jgi:autotransporter-associated beta strand protein
VIVSSVCGSARAQNTWTGGGANGSWATNANWSTGTAPANNFTTALVFSGSTFLSNTNSLTGGTVTSLSFDAAAGAFTLNGNAITLGGAIVNSSTNLQTIAMGLNVNGTRTLTMTAGGGDLALTGTLGGSGGLTLSGTGTTTLSGTNTYAGRTTLGPGTTVRFTGTNALVTGGTIANTNTAGTYAIQFAAGASMSSTTSVIEFTANTVPSTTGSISLDGFSQTLRSLRMGQKNLFSIASTTGSPTFSVSGTTFIGSDNSSSVSGTLAPTGGVNVVLNSVYSETPTAGPARTNTLVLDGTTTGNQINGGLFDVAFNGTNAAIAVTKQNVGTWTLSGSSGYTGPTTVSGGVLALSGPATLGASGSSAVTLSGGRLDLGSSSQSVGAVTISAASASGNTLQGGSLTGTSYSITNTSGTVTVTTSLLGVGALTKTGSGTVVLQGTNSYAGATSVRGTLTVNGGGAITGGGGLTIGGGSAPTGTFNYNTTASSTFGAIIIGNGNDGAANATFNQTAGSIVGSSLVLNNSFTQFGAGDLNISGGYMNITGDATVSNQVAGPATPYSTITVSGTASLTIGGSLSLTGAPAAARNGWGRVTQNGGTVTVGSGLTMAQTTAGNSASRNGEYNLNGGTLNVSLIRQDAGVDTTGTFNFNGGTLAATASSGTFMQGLTAANVRNGGAIIDTGTFGITIGQNLRHSTIGGDAAIDGGLRKLGGGMLALSGSNTYTGTTTIVAGTLQIGAGGTTGSLLASSTITGSAGAVLAFNRTNTLTQGTHFSNVIGGAVSVAQVGSGTLVLGGTNTYTGTTSIQNGTLQLGAGGTTGVLATGGVTLVNGTGSGTFAVSRSNTVTQGTDFPTRLTGSIAFAQVGTGTTILNSSSNTYQGGTRVDGGELRIGVAGALGSTAGSLAVNGGRLDMNGFSTTVGVLSGSSGGVITTTSAATLTVSSTADSTYGGIFSGSTSLRKTGLATLTLSGSSTNAGPTLIDSGTLALGANNAISGSSAITLGTGTSFGSLFLGPHNLTTASLTFTGSGGAIPDSAGVMTLQGLSGSSATISVLGGLANEIHPDIVMASNGVIDIASGASLLLHANVGGTRSLTKNGLGRLDIFGNNSGLSGPFTINSGTVRLIGGLSQLGTGTATINTGATLDLNDRPFSGNYVLAGGTLVNIATGTVFVTATSTISGTDASNAVFQVTSTGNATFNTALTNGYVSILGGGVAAFNGGVTGSSSAVVVSPGGTATFASDVAGLVSGTGTMTFNGTILPLGTIEVYGTSAFHGLVSSTAGVHVHPGALGTFSGTTTGAVTVDGVATFSNTLDTTSQLNVSVGGQAQLLNGANVYGPDIENAGNLLITNTTPITIAASIGGNGTVTKQGPGMLSLTGASDGTGAFNVLSGTLAVNGSLGSAPLSIAASAWLQGTGTIAGPVSVAGTLSPGNSPGVITLASVVLDGTSTTRIEVNGTTRGSQYDGVDVTGSSGSLTYGGLLSLSFGNVSALPNHMTFDLFNFTGGYLGTYSAVSSTGFYSGTWTPLGSGTFQLVKDSQTLTFSQTTGDIIAVPEPAALALAGMGVGVAGWLIRRWARQTAPRG